MAAPRRSRSKGTGSSGRKRKPNAVALVGDAPEVKARALVAFKTFGIVTDACEASAIARSTWYRWIREDPEFAERVRNTEEEVTDRLEKRGYERAVADKEGSDRLLEFFLKSRRPERFRDRQEITVVSPAVKERLHRTVQLIGSRKSWPADELLALLDGVWQ